MDGSARYKLALTLLVYVFSTSAWSATWWVATDGSDDAAGTDVAPLRTIQAALDVASGGDVINVRSGIYPEALLISRFADNAKPLTLQAAPDATPVLDGTTIGDGKPGAASEKLRAIYIEEAMKTAL